MQSLYLADNFSTVDSEFRETDTEMEVSFKVFFFSQIYNPFIYLFFYIGFTPRAEPNVGLEFMDPEIKT